MSHKADIEWTLELDDGEEHDVLIEYSWTSGSPGCAPSLEYPGDPPEPSEIEFLRISRLDTGEELIFDPYGKLPSHALDRLLLAIDEQEYERLDAGPEADWRNEW